MNLRYATKEDYETFVELDQYENDVMFYTSQKTSNETLANETLLTMFDEETLQQIEFSKEQFENCIDLNCCKQYIFEDDNGDPIGFILLNKMSATKWQLEYLLIRNEVQTLEVFTQCFQKLKKISKISEIHVVLIIPEARERFINIGFEHYSLNSFFKLKLRKTR